MDIDQEFTGDRLLQLVLSIEAAVGLHSAGATPLGAAVTRLCEETYWEDQKSLAQAQDKHE